jgi:hypothetical protein
MSMVHISSSTSGLGTPTAFGRRRQDHLVIEMFRASEPP